MSKNKIFLEAILNSDEQEQKMDAWHAGKRGFNAKAASDEKLKLNYDICVRKNYQTEAAIIKTEAASRHLPWAMAATAKNNTNSQPEPRVMPNWAAEVKITDDILRSIDYAWLRQDDINALLRDFNAIDTSLLTNKTGAELTSIIAMVASGIKIIIILLLLDKNDNAVRLKDYLYEMYGISGESIKQIIRTFLADEQLLQKTKKALAEKKNSVLKENIEKHDTLNPLLWNSDNTLKPEVKEKIDLVVAEFLDDLANNEVKISIKDIILVGSNCSYNYTKDSDLDIHLLADTTSLECPDNLYPKLYSAYRSLFNSKFDIDFYGIPVEIYVETEEGTVNSNGIYSVLNNAWIKTPISESIPEIDQEALDAEFAVWEQRYNEIIEESKKENIELKIETK